MSLSSEMKALCDRIDARIDRIGRQTRNHDLVTRALDLQSDYRRRGFDSDTSADFALTAARRQLWSEADEKRAADYCKLAGLNYNDQSDYSKAVCAVLQNEDLPGAVNPVLLRIRDLGGDPNDPAQYSAAAGEIYTIDPDTHMTVLKSKYSHYARKEG